MRRIFKKLLDPVTQPSRLPLIFVGLGILLRARRYLANPSFWGDEAWIAHAITRRSFTDILWAQNIDRHDPLGFHLIEKYLISLFGDSEFAFRLFPFLCSLAAVILFYRLSRRCLEPRAVAVATGLFALCDQLTFYAAETHPYSSDVLFTVLMLLYFIRLNDTSADDHCLKSILTAGIGGALLIWISYPSIFILAGIGLTILIDCFLKKKWQTTRRFRAPLGLWFLSFLAYYLHYLHPVTHQSYMKPFLLSLNPHPFLSPDWLAVYANNILLAFKTPLGFNPPLLGVLMFFAGSFALAQKNKDFFFLTHIPIAITLLTAALDIYPFYGRLILFLVPLMILVLSEGVIWVISRNRICPAIITPALLAFLFAAPLHQSWSHLIRIHEISEVRPLIDYLKQHWQDNDALFMENDTQYPYFYYARRLNFAPGPKPTAVFSNRPFLDEKTGKQFFYIAYEGWRSCEKIYPGNAIPCVDKHVYADSSGVFPETSRAWFLLAQTRDGLEDFLLGYLNKIGKKLKEVRTPTTSLLLYDLRKDHPL